MKKINLSDIPKQDPFKVPDGYLERLPLMVQSRVQHKPLSYEKREWQWLLQPKLQMAFSLLLLLFVFVLELQRPQVAVTDPHLILEEISQQEVVNYLSNAAQLSVQELVLEANGRETDIYTVHDLPAPDVLEEDILQDIDTYTAEDLWK